MTIRIRKRGSKWQLDYRDPASGRRIRRSTSARNRREAQQIAEATHRQMLNQMYPSSAGPCVSIAHAIEQSIANSTANERTQANYRHQAGQIAAWFAEHYPGATCATVTLEILRAFVDHCAATCAPATVGMRVFVLKSALRHAAAIHGTPDPTGAWRVRIRRDPTKEREMMERKILTPSQIRSMLYALDGAPLAVCALQALAGLRVTEAINLAEDDIDLSLTGTITIRDTQWHRLKNSESHRVIPICDALRDAITTAFPDFGKVITIQANLRGIERAPLIRTARGKRFTESDWSHLMRRTFDLIAEITGDPAFKGYQPRWLRASFATAVRSMRVDDRLVKAYMGHSRGDTLGRHYEHLGRVSLLPVASAIETWLKTETGDLGGIAGSARDV